MYYNQLNTYIDECRALQKSEKELQILCGLNVIITTIISTITKITCLEKTLPII